MTKQDPLPWSVLKELLTRKSAGHPRRTADWREMRLSLGWSGRLVVFEGAEGAGPTISDWRLRRGKDRECGPSLCRCLGHLRPPAETLPAPEFSAEPATLHPAPGSLVQLRCRAPRAGLRFALVRDDRDGHQVLDLQSPAGAEALFEMRDVSQIDSANYSCIYVDTAPPFAGSVPSAHLELRVDGEWTGPPPARCIVRCPPVLAVKAMRSGPLY